MDIKNKMLWLQKHHGLHYNIQCNNVSHKNILLLDYQLLCQLNKKHAAQIS